MFLRKESMRCPSDLESVLWRDIMLKGDRLKLLIYSPKDVGTLWGFGVCCPFWSYIRNAQVGSGSCRRTAEGDKNCRLMVEIVSRRLGF